jgi:hypothetical protein
VQELKILLMTSVGKDLCEKVFEIALNDQEERIACHILLFYKLNITKRCVIRATYINAYDVL